MNADQEIRAKAIEIKVRNSAQLALGCLIANRSFESTVWNAELEEICEYIKTGKKPESKDVNG